MKLYHRSLSLLLLAVTAPLHAQDPAIAPNRIRDLISSRRDALPEGDARARLDKILGNPAEFRAQILLGEVVEVEGKKKLVRTGWRDDAEYFYPASTVKLCGAVAALERVNELRRGTEPGLMETTPLAFHPSRRSKEFLADDPTNLEGAKITLQHLIRRVFLVSDNDAFNRLYDFCGQNWLNRRMWRAGLDTVRISHRLSVALSKNDNKYTPIVELRYPEGPRLLGEDWGTENLDLQNFGHGVYVGKSHYADGEKIKHPMSFFLKNAMSLADLQTCLARIVRPDIVFEKGEPFDLTEAQRALLLDALSTYPGDSKNPLYDRAKFPDEYCKFFLSGLARVVPKERLKVYSKVGNAYGFVVDTSYVVDSATDRGFFLAAAVYANSDGVVNDDKYDEESVAFPWLADVAEIVARDVWKQAK